MLSHPAIRLLAAIFLVFGGLLLHEIVQAFAREPLIVVGSIEQAIPFLSWTIWIYFSFFALIAWTALTVRSELFVRFVLAASLAAVVAWTVLLALPISFERPEAASIIDGLHRKVFAFVHAADPSHVSFPSLHVAVTWICTFTLWNRSHSAWLFLLASAISVSTLLTKQHLVIDVVGGVALAWVCVRVTHPG